LPQKQEEPNLKYHDRKAKQAYLGLSKPVSPLLGDLGEHFVGLFIVHVPV
jgi:hypothetical protein